jgi:signal transduction histidine kinase
MKLVTKTILLYLLISIPTLFFASWLSYKTIKSEIAEDELESIQRERLLIKELIDQNQIKDFTLLSVDRLSTIEVTNHVLKPSEFVKDTLLFDRSENEFIEYKLYVSFIQKEHHSYKVTLAKNQQITSEFFENLMFTISWILLLLVLVFFLVNWIISKVIWKPFFRTLNKLEGYSIQDHRDEYFEESTTTEFHQLNRALTEMTNTIYKTYQEQKEFTENASHEMQTPLAILSGNVDMLLQSPNLNENDMLHIERIERSIQKLSSLNKTLLLLAKIENKQFLDRKKINFNQLVDQSILQFEDYIQSKEISIEKEIPEDFEIELDVSLAEILINNLLQNAIRHNELGGKIILYAINNTFSISNTGPTIDFEQSELFTRFKKSSVSTDSTGLGLSIVKSIANTYGFSVDYSFENALHSFILKF